MGQLRNPINLCRPRELLDSSRCHLVRLDFSLVEIVVRSYAGERPHAKRRGVDLISLFTVGANEVRAWTIRRSTAARRPAGKIHSDLERGFIRAEVIPYETFIDHGSEQAVREAGLLQVEGKDYVVSDADLMNIQFNAWGMNGLRLGQSAQEFSLQSPAHKPRSIPQGKPKQVHLHHALSEVGLAGVVDSHVHQDGSPGLRYRRSLLDDR